MGTWNGAIIDGARPDALRAAAKDQGLELHGDPSSRLLVNATVSLGSLGVPPFAEPLSEALACTVVAFAMQTTGSVAEVQHWESGRLARHLYYSADEGGWLTQEGERQAWESAFFFAEDEGTGEGQEWPFNLTTDLSDEDLVRYERARAARDASSIMDLIEGDSMRSIELLCGAFGVAPDPPRATYHSRRSWKSRVDALVLSALGAINRAGR